MISVLLKKNKNKKKWNADFLVREVNLSQTSMSAIFLLLE